MDHMRDGKTDNWLRGRDLNPRPRGYEPRELTGLLYPDLKNVRPSFGGLLKRNQRTRNFLRPLDAIWPMIGQPLHGTFKSACDEIAALGNIIELRTAIKNNLRHAHSPDAQRLGIAIGSQKDLLPHVHGRTMRSLVLIVKRQMSAF